MWNLLAWRAATWIDGAWTDRNQPEIHPEPSGVSTGGFPMRPPKKGEYSKRRRRQRDEEIMFSMLC